MSGEKEDQEPQGFATPQDVIDYIYAGLIAMKIPEEIAKEFICLRAHFGHPWGLMHVTVNGKPSFALIRPADDEGLLKVSYIVPPAGLRVEDLYGNPMDSKNQLLADPPQAHKKPN